MRACRRPATRVAASWPVGSLKYWKSRAGLTLGSEEVRYRRPLLRGRGMLGVMQKASIGVS